MTDLNLDNVNLKNANIEVALNDKVIKASVEDKATQGEGASVTPDAMPA